MEQTAAMDTGLFLFALGAIVYLGVIGSYIFERYKIPDVLNLILIGIFLGPVLNLVHPSLLTPWMPIVGAVALGLILFDGGLDLDLDHVLERFGASLLLATGTFLTSTALITYLFHLLTGASWVNSLLLGSTLGCVSSAVILPVCNLLTVPDKTKTTIHLEAALSDMWGVVFTLALIRLAPTQQFDAGHTVNAMVGAFTTAILAAVAFGMLWLWALSRLRESPFAYMMTLAAVFVLYGFIELIHGSGPMAALAFGAVLTNADKIAKLFHQKFKFVLDEKIRLFNTEATFFVRTFFFVYLGLVVSFDILNWKFLAVSLALFCAILVCRYAVVRLSIRFFYPEEAPHTQTYLAMLPRGLTSAVLVGMVQSRISGTQDFLEYAFAVILLTNVLMTWWVHRNEKPKELSEAPSAAV